MELRIGQGVDFHRFEAGRRLVLGGVEFHEPYGLIGHSDADVVLHAIADAILGAAGLGDIGIHFPDTDQKWLDADSRLILKEVAGRAAEKGLRPVNVDVTIIAQQPRIAPRRPEMEDTIADLLSITRDRVNVKATTTEAMGALGRKEGIASIAVVLMASP